VAARLYTESNGPISLGPPLGSGGEGTIHRVEGDGLVVAKLYVSHRLGAELEAKLTAMAARPPDDPTWKTQRHRSIAWARHVLYRGRGRAGFAGFLMPYIDTKVFREAHKYFDRSDRLAQFGGNFTWRHLLAAAQNLASCVAAIHAQNHRIGDLRETNVLIAENALVCLIDCDSFQIRDAATGKVYPTRVGTGEYLPPELLGSDFGRQDVDRYHSDLFALAVLVFKLLMQGVHPFQARGPRVASAPTTEAKIKLGTFPYEQKRGIAPPPYAPPYGILPKELRDLFKACFVEGHTRPARRPTAEAWFRALRNVERELRHCSFNANHWYAREISCPWCAEVKAHKPDLFPRPMGLGQQIAAVSAQAAPETKDQRRAFLATYLNMALADGSLTAAEEKYIEDVALQLGLSVAETRSIVDRELKKRGARRGAVPAAAPAPVPPRRPAPPPPARPTPTPSPPAVTPVPRAAPRPARGMPAVVRLASIGFVVSAWLPYRAGRRVAEELGVDSVGAFVAPPLPDCGAPFAAAAGSQWAFASALAVAAAVGATFAGNRLRNVPTRFTRTVYVLLGAFLVASFALSSAIAPIAKRTEPRFASGGYLVSYKTDVAACAFAGGDLVWTRENFGQRWVYNGRAETFVTQRRVPGEPSEAPRLVAGFRLATGELAWQHKVRKPLTVFLDLGATRKARYAYAVVQVRRTTGRIAQTVKLSFRTGKQRRGTPRRDPRFWRN
jgi:hypothetical protein